MPIGKAVIGQSGGPTAVINKSLVGFIKEAINQEYDEILGARHGLEGILRRILLIYLNFQSLNFMEYQKHLQLL